MKVQSTRLPQNHDFGATVKDCYVVARQIMASNPLSKVLIVLKDEVHQSQRFIENKRTNSFSRVVTAIVLDTVGIRSYTHFVYERAVLDMLKKVQNNI